jgi:hypothetical protein
MKPLFTTQSHIEMTGPKQGIELWHYSDWIWHEDQDGQRREIMTDPKQGNECVTLLWLNMTWGSRWAKKWWCITYRQQIKAHLLLMHSQNHIVVGLEQWAMSKDAFTRIWHVRTVLFFSNSVLRIVVGYPSVSAGNSAGNEWIPRWKSGWSNE